MSEAECSTTSANQCAGLKCRSDFLFLQELGEGSYSTVYKAKLRSSDLVLAVKVCNKRQIIRDRKVEQIRREKDALIRLSAVENRHAFFTQIYCTFQDVDSLYIVTNLAKGGDLLKQLRKRHIFSLDTTKFCASEIVTALGHMHSLNIIHRDLKPENILLSESGHIMISDFGCSLLTDQKELKSTDRRRRCSFVGTPQYISPEVLNGVKIEQACDYWALGVIVYQCLTGCFPFTNDSEYYLFKKICKASYTIPNDFPLHARNFIEQLIVVNTSERLGSNHRSGVANVMQHEFFDGINWNQIEHVVSPFVDLIYSV